LIKYADPESHFLLRAKELDARLHVS